MKRAIFPGSFDPFTVGHFDIVKRGLEIFDEIIIGIGRNSTKKETFPIREREEAIRKIFAHSSSYAACVASATSSTSVTWQRPTSS